jgi:hypothetical protein
MRIRVVRRPPVGSIDGIRLDRFEPGSEHELGSSLGALFLSEGWGVPASHDPTGPPLKPPNAPDSIDPPNLHREIQRPLIDPLERETAADAGRRTFIKRVK